MQQDEEALTTEGASPLEPTGSFDDLRQSLLQEEGEPLATPNSKGFEWRELKITWLLAYPLLVSFCCRMIMASTDSSFVGHLDTPEHPAEDYLVAATLSDMVLSVVIAPPLAFNRVLDALVSQAVGSGNRPLAGVWLQQSVVFLSLGMLCTIPAVFFVKDILRLLGFRESICELAGTYAMWNVFWFIPNGIYQCLRFYFQALGIPRPAMYNNVLFVFVNAALNWVFVFGGPFQYFSMFGNWKGFGFVGAAISLSFSRTLQPVTYAYYMFYVKSYHKDAWPGWDLSMHTKTRMKEFLMQSLPRVGTNIFQSVIGQSTTILISQLGAEAVAASTAVSVITRIYTGALCATTASVTAIRVGFHLGRGDYFSAKRSGYLVMRWTVILMLIPSLLIFVFQDAVLSVVTNDPQVQRATKSILFAALVGKFPIVLVQICTAGVFGGQGRTRLIAILSFAFEMPMSIGGIAVVVLLLHASLSDVFWYTLVSASIETAVCLLLVWRSDWKRLSAEAIDRSR